MSKQSPDPLADARARLQAAERVVRDLEGKSERLVWRGKEIGDQIAALGFKVHAENDRAATIANRSLTKWVGAPYG